MEPVNILLVDNSRDLDTLDSILARPDYHVFRAPTANDALLALANRDFAVIVADNDMPIADRFKIAGLSKNRKGTRHIPVIFLMDRYEDSDLALGHGGAGAVDYLSKPVNPLVLRSKVAVFVDLYRKTHELARLNQTMETEIAHRLKHMRTTLREKETLLQETHHRVKNNLQVISSLLNLQADNLPDGDARWLFLDARDRVRSMALVHEKLYQSDNSAGIELGEYLNGLMKELLRAHVGLAQTVRFRIEQQEIFLPVDWAIPCGLIVNELVTNALKHAFHGRAGGEIAIALRLLDDQRICIVIGDDGSGLPQGLEWNSSDSFGLRLVRLLTEQLNGTLDLRDGPGTVFQLTFNAPVAERLGEAISR